MEVVIMANVGTFKKCKRQIESGIRQQKRKGFDYVALDLPYYAKSDQLETDAYIKQLEDRGMRVEISHTDSSKYGKASW